MMRLTILCSLLLTLGCQEAAGPLPVPAPTTAPEDAAPRMVAVPEPVPASDEPVEVAPPPEDGAVSLLLWGRDADGGAYTWWLESDRHGGWDVVEAEGIYVASGDALWQWITETEELPLGMDCDLFDQGGEPPVDTGRTGTGVRATLARVGGEERITVMEPAREVAFDTADYGESVRLEGSVGPVLFVHRSAWDYACGAHGGEMHSFLAFDLSQRSAAALYDTDASEALTQRLRGEAWAALQQDMPFAEGPEELSLTVHRPVFAEDGRLLLDHQLTASTCYACSDGDWDSYTTSSHVRDEALPAALSPHADYPLEAVRWLHGQVEGLDLRGISHPDPALRPLFEEYQVPGC